MQDEQLLRYGRHLVLPEIDFAGQQALLASRVLVLGVGGLGSAAAYYLTAAGVGHLHLVDPDEVDLSNLQRQIAHQYSRLGQPKVESAYQQLSALNPETQFTLDTHTLDDVQLTHAIQAADLVLDCTDNFATRFQLNRLCYAQKTPWISGAAIRWVGQIMYFNPQDKTSPCYACLYDEQQADDAENCHQNGIAAPIVGVIGSLQALEAIKQLAQISPATPPGFWQHWDALAGQWHTRLLPLDPECPVCASLSSVNLEPKL
ncbi:adenylyltransferase and sulfurtransferase [Allopseudospirillum japonicum]|uniref:Adenylyltransferase and sulfurtransferase n=1 Tax=Allopseudospirillum japonicum TaxID=64971 RepID=A0A1H6RW50_9GAMM|nr:molybdopterin-synthase adenylyltransferase MoeB [Allopseudospirillum japonicum]SEI60088.1 adenylyltransferase and sulfurtransferase [Allopseudospirillum japonicum]